MHECLEVIKLLLKQPWVYLGRGRYKPLAVHVGPVLVAPSAGAQPRQFPGAVHVPFKEERC